MYDIFISYRRDGGHEMARLLYEHLKSKGLKCFFDLEELGAGEFNVKLLDSIEDSKNFILILSPNSLERCHNEGDWVRCEIEHAIKCGKNIVPLMLPGFEWPDNLPESLAKLPFYNGVQLVREYFDASIDKLISMLDLDPETRGRALNGSNVEKTYQDAVNGLGVAKKRKQFIRLAKIFVSLGTYKDSAAKAKECYAKARKIAKKRTRILIVVAVCATILASTAGILLYKQLYGSHIHTYGEWVIDKEATCTQTGTRHHVCTDCKKSVSETIPINASAHSFGEWIVDTAATCMQSGTRHHVCTVCQKSVSVTYSDSSAHNFSSTWTSDNSNHWHKCQNSGCTMVTGRTNHTFGEWIIDTPATCVKPGTRHHVCTTCNKSVSESYSDPNAHNYASTWTSDDTNHWHGCQNSGCTSAKDKTAHTFGEWVVDKEPTKVKDGARHTECTVCRMRLDEILYATGSIGLAYSKNSDGKSCTITGIGTCVDDDIVIPSVIDGMKVTSISDVAFKDCWYLTSVGFAENSNLTKIGEETFCQCSSLTSITIPNSVKSIGSSAFYSCESLTSITIPNSVTKIGGSAFYGTYKLEAVYINDMKAWCSLDYSFPYTRWSAYSPIKLYLNGVQVTDLVIPEGVTKISAYAFHYVEGIRSVTIPDSVTSIGQDAFAGCTNLTSVTFGENSRLTSISDHAFNSCGLTSITIPDGVTSIGKYAFSGCSNLTSINIPDSVTSIGEKAFYYCDSLTSITFEGTKAQWENIRKGPNWNYKTPTITVTCTDGTVTVK